MGIQEDFPYSRSPVGFTQAVGHGKRLAATICSAPILVRKGKVTKAVCDYATAQPLDTLQDVRMMANDDIGSRCDHFSCKPAIFGVRRADIFLPPMHAQNQNIAPLSHCSDILENERGTQGRNARTIVAGVKRGQSRNVAVCQNSYFYIPHGNVKWPASFF